MKTVMFRVRIEPELKQQLIEAVQNGKAESMSDLVRKALKQFLSKEGVYV